MRLHADGVEHRVRPATAGHVPDGVAEVLLVLAEVDHLDAAGGDAGQPLGHQVHADHAVALVLGDPTGEVTDRAQAEDDERAALGHVRVLHALPGGRQDVGEVGEPVVRRALGQLDVGELRLRHPQVLRLATGDLAVELGEAEQRRTHALVAHLRRLALGVQLPAHIQQFPQEIWNGMATRSPTFRSPHSAPTSTTWPMFSWPRMSPLPMNGAIGS